MICPSAKAEVIVAMRPVARGPATARASCMPASVITMKVPPTRRAATMMPPTAGRRGPALAHPRVSVRAEGAPDHRGPGQREHPEAGPGPSGARTRLHEDQARSPRDRDPRPDAGEHGAVQQGAPRRGESLETP